MPGTANSRGCRLGAHGWLSSVHANRHTLELLRRPAVMPSLPSVLPLGRRVAAAAGRPKADAPISRDTLSFGAAPILPQRTPRAVSQRARCPGWVWGALVLLFRLSLPNRCSLTSKSQLQSPASLFAGPNKEAAHHGLPGGAAADRQGHERGVSQCMQCGCLLCEPLQPCRRPRRPPCACAQPTLACAHLC